MIYLDNNATTPVDPEVYEAMEPYLREEYGNPSSKFYTLASNAEIAVEEARESVAKLINSRPEEIIFTSSGSESNNFIIKGISDYYKNYLDKGNHILTSKVEHESVRNSCRFLNGEIYMNREKKENKYQKKKIIDRGFEVDFLNTNSKGQVELDEIVSKIKDKTILGSFIWANNELGSINDIAKILKEFEKRDIFLHSDATQAVGKIKVDVKETGLDALTFSSHKIYGPKGIGATFLKKDKYRMPDITSLIHGGDNQELGYRAGTLSVHNIVGFGKAAELARLELEDNMEKMGKLEGEFIKILKEKYPEAIILSDSEGVPGVISYILPGVNNMLHIKKIGDKIAISSGSACSITGDSHVLEAIGMSKYKSNFFRASFNKFIDKNDFKIIKEYI